MMKIKDRLLRIQLNLKLAHGIPYVVIITSALYLVELFFFLVYGIIKEKDIILLDFPGKEKDLVYLLFAVIIAPLFETWFNQVLPYKLLNKIKYLKERSYLILLISALFFGLLHFYSLFYIFYGFLMGLVLMYGYMIRIETDKNTFYLIAVSHSLLNLGVFVINLFL